MKKIYEFKVFDILQNEENVKFLDKVKKENPDLYTKFLNLIGNKGLDAAKERYHDYEPEYVKKKIEREKKISAAEKKKMREEEKESEKQEVLDKHKEIINEIETAIFWSDIKDIENVISKDKNIQEYLKSCNVRKSRENNFNKTLNKSASSIEYELKSSSTLLETVYYKTKSFFSYWYDENKTIINLQHYYNKREKKSHFSIHINLFDEPVISVDINKEEEFITDRNKYISSKLNKYGVSTKDIIDSINKLSLLLTDSVYQEWYKDWELKKDTEKYNL